MKRLGRITRGLILIAIYYLALPYVGVTTPEGWNIAGFCLLNATYWQASEMGAFE